MTSHPVKSKQTATRKSRQSASAARIPRSLTAAALKHFCGALRIGSSAVDAVEEMLASKVVHSLKPYFFLSKPSCFDGAVDCLGITEFLCSHRHAEHFSKFSL